jgi:hypothetical protein
VSCLGSLLLPLGVFLSILWHLPLSQSSSQASLNAIL